ncbi:MAG: BrnT family toxin [Bryobacteraceae bacterium]
MDVEFTWNPEKAKRNLAKQKVSFEAPRRAFTDPHLIVLEDREDERGEMRYHAIGYAGPVLLLVVFADRSKGDREIIHIISARKADKYEQSSYADQF